MACDHLRDQAPGAFPGRSGDAAEAVVRLRLLEDALRLAAEDARVMRIHQEFRNAFDSESSVFCTPDELRPIESLLQRLAGFYESAAAPPGLDLPSLGFRLRAACRVMQDTQEQEQGQGQGQGQGLGPSG